MTSGGVSMGPHDLVRRVAAELGVEEIFWGVAVKPGKPLSFGVRGETLVFGLPGNPVSSLVGALALRQPGAPRAAGARAVRGRATCRRVDGRASAAIRSATSSCAREALDRTTASCSSRRRPGVAHDRPRAAAPMRSSTSPAARARSPPAAPFGILVARLAASARARAERRRAAAARRRPRTAHSGRTRALHLRCRREPDECRRAPSQRDVADGGETDRVEGGVHDRDPELVREKQERDQRPGEPGGEEKRRVARTGARAAARAKRRATEARRRAHRDSRVQGRPRRPRAVARAVARPASRSSAVVGRCGARRLRATSHPSTNAPASSSEPTDRRVCRRTSVNGGSGSGAPVGSTPARAPSQIRTAPRSADRRAAFSAREVPA